MVYAVVIAALIAVLFGVHLFGAKVCQRVMDVIAGSATEADVRASMVGVRDEMIVWYFWQGPRLTLGARPSYWGYHSMNATVWLAIYDNRYLIADDLVADALLLHRLRWIELGLMAATFAVFGVGILRAFA